MGKKTPIKPYPGRQNTKPAAVAANPGIPKVIAEQKKSWFTPVRKQYLFLFILAVGLYANTLDMQYACDDALMITQNKFTVKGISGIKEIFTNDAFVGLFGKNNLLPGGRYRPLSQVMFAVEYEIFGLNPFIGHLINVIFYGLLALLLFHVLRKLMPAYDNKLWYLALPFIATILFIAHPLHTEVVANIKGRDELMSLGGCLGSLFFFVSYIDRQKIMDLFWAVICFFLAILSKENALAWFAVIPVTLYFFRKNSTKRILITLIPLGIGVAAYFLVRTLALGYLVNDVSNNELMNNPFLGATTAQKYATILYTWGKYFLLLIFPQPLTHDYYPKQIPLIGFGDIRTILSLLVTLGTVAIAIVFLKRRHIVAFAILFFWLTFSMSSNLLVNIGAFMNERFMFSSLLGFTLIIAWLMCEKLPLWIKKKETWRQAALVILIILLSGYTLKTVTRNRVWKNDLTLFTTDVEVSTNSAKCNTSAGGKLSEYADSTKNPIERQQSLEKAVKYLNRAVEIYPGGFNGWEQLGLAHIKLKQYPEARICFMNCLNINSASSGTLRNLLHIAQATNNEKLYRESIITYKLLLHYQPDSARHYFGIGLAYKNAGILDTAVSWFNKTLEKDPKYGDAWGKLGEIFGQNFNDLQKSEQFLRKAVECNPKDASALENLGIVYGIRKDFKTSIDFFMQALAISPDNGALNQNIGQTYMIMGQKDAAEKYFIKAKQLEATKKEKE